jgi:hypothetical protein
VALGITAAAHAQADNQPAVTLGPPTVALGAPRAAPSSAVTSDIAPCSFGAIARGKADDKAPMPPGPALSGEGTGTLTPPTPLAPAGPMTGGPVYGGPVSSGPIVDGPIGGGYPMSGQLPGAACGPAADPSWAPLPGGVFSQDAHPCGYIFYGSAEALLWWIRDGRLPPLLIASPPSSSLAPPPGSTVVFGGGSVAPQERVGGRFTVGWWLNECQNVGVVGSYFFLARRGVDFAVAGNPTTELSRPFFNINPAVGGSPTMPVPDRERISSPGLAVGAFNASTSDTLWGADINGRINLLSGCRWRVDGLVGFRYLRFDEDLRIGETFDQVAPASVAGRMGTLMDHFETTNDFYGGQLGLMGEIHRGPWSLDLMTKVALGTTHQSIIASGGQMGVNEFGQTVSGYGLLVQPSNVGSHTRNVFSVVPEVSVNIGYQLTQRLKVFAGYDFLYWSGVARAGDQIDPVLDVNSRVFPIAQPPGATRPAIRFQDSGFWAQGFNFGLQFTW